MNTKKYRVVNPKYGEVDSEVTFDLLQKVAEDKVLDRPLREEDRKGVLVVTDSYGVVVAKREPEPTEKAQTKPATAAKTEPATEKDTSKE